MGGTSRVRRAVMRSAVVAALALTAALASAVGPQAAHATGVTVTGIGTRDTGGIAVHLLDPSALWVQVSVRASADPDAAVLAATDALTSFSWDDGWYTDTPLRLPDGTPHGDYPVDVDYRLADGTVQHWSGAANGAVALFHYESHLGIGTVGTDRASTDFDHRQVTVSGRVDAFDPATASTAPAGAGVPVRLAWTSRNGTVATQHSTTVPTADDGTFSAAITPDGSLSAGTAAVVTPPTGTAANAATAAIPDVAADAIHVRITGTPATARAHAGTHVHMSGTVQRLTAQGWQPLAGATVVTTSQSPDYWAYTTPGLMGSGTSDSAGHYGYDVTATRTVTASTYVHYSDYVVHDNQELGATISVPTSGTFSPTMTPTLDMYRYVHAHAYLYGNCGYERVSLQRSANGHTGWTTLATVTASEHVAGHPCSFTVSAYGGANAYYRVAHSESDQMLAAVSRTFHLYRIATRVTPFAMSSSNPYPGSKLSASGRVTAWSGHAWVSMRSAPVVLVFRPRGSSTWYRVLTGHTSSTGSFRLYAGGTASYYGDGYWGLYYAADSRHLYSQSVERYVNVR